MSKARFQFAHGCDLHRCITAEWSEGEQSEQGFMLVGLIVAIFIILMVLGIAAPRVAQDLKRERELEAVHRGNQYVRAIQLYYRKNNTYPGQMDLLTKGTTGKYLRQEYVDPFTGKADWRLIHVGEAKTTVKGFFGQPLTGLAPGLGSASGLASPGGTGAGAAGTGPGLGSGSGSAFGASSGSAFGASSAGPGGYGSSGSSSMGGSGLGATNSTSVDTSLGATSSASGTAAGTSTGSATGSATGTDSSGIASSGTGSPGTGAPNTLGSASGIASQSSGGFSGGGAPFVGVGIPKEGTSIIVLNEQKSYNTWEFIYDPRIEQMKAKAGLFGGGSQGLGSAGGLSSGVGGAGSTSGFGSSGSSGYGSPSGSGFGSSSGSGFGSSSGSGFGSSPNSGTQGTGTTSPTTPQQPQ